MAACSGWNPVRSLRRCPCRAAYVMQGTFSVGDIAQVVVDGDNVREATTDCAGKPDENGIATGTLADGTITWTAGPSSGAASPASVNCPSTTTRISGGLRDDGGDAGRPAPAVRSRAADGRSERTERADLPGGVLPQAPVLDEYVLGSDWSVSDKTLSCPGNRSMGSIRRAPTTRARPRSSGRTATRRSCRL